MHDSSTRQSAFPRAFQMCRAAFMEECQEGDYLCPVDHYLAQVLSTVPLPRAIAIASHLLQRLRAREAAQGTTTSNSVRSAVPNQTAESSTSSGSAGPPVANTAAGSDTFD